MYQNHVILSAPVAPSGGSREYIYVLGPLSLVEAESAGRGAEICKHRAGTTLQGVGQSWGRTPAGAQKAFIWVVSKNREG